MSVNFKTWIILNSKNAQHNFNIFRALLKSKTKIWAVVKSNSYGHGLIDFSKILNTLGIDGFCVDSVIEALKLRQNGIKKPILVLGPTLPNLFETAQKNNIIITISNFEHLNKYLKSKNQPQFHLKIDTGMHRQGFYLQDLSKIIKLLKSRILNPKPNLTGIYTHFASAKDINYPTFTEWQFEQFFKVVKKLEKAGFKNLIKHCAATGATLINPKYHLDTVRIGIGLYGLWPSKELEVQFGNKIKLKPILSWQALISEIKNIKKGDYIGYDLIERLARPTQAALIPIGYWHGFDRKLTSIGEVLIKGKRARVLGRVSMDLIVVDATDIKCKIGDKVVIIGRQGKEKITATEIAQKIGTTHYEVVTRINPLIEKIVI